MALWAITARISGFGFTPNRVAAPGMNEIRLVTFAWSAVVYTRFLGGANGTLERWQTNYLPLYVVWTAS